MSFETIGAAVGAFIIGILTVLGFLGKIVNVQVQKSFDHAMNGDGNGKAGLRTDLRTDLSELKSDIRDLGTRFDNWKERCDRTHNPLDEKVASLTSIANEAKATAEKAMQLSRENADQLSYLK